MGRWRDNPTEWTPQRITELRERLGLTRKQMAQQMGIHWQTLARWEQGYFQPSNMATKKLDAISKRAGATG